MTRLHREAEDLGRGRSPHQLGCQPEQGAHAGEGSFGFALNTSAVQHERRLPNQGVQHVDATLDHGRGAEHLDDTQYIAIAREREDAERKADRPLDRNVDRLLRSEDGPTLARPQATRAIVRTPRDAITRSRPEGSGTPPERWRRHLPQPLGSSEHRRRPNSRAQTVAAQRVMCASEPTSVLIVRAACGACSPAGGTRIRVWNTPLCSCQWPTEIYLQKYPDRPSIAV